MLTGRFAIAVALVGLCAVTVPNEVWAQGADGEAPGVASPQTRTADGLGVDLIGGSVDAPKPSVSIGASGSGLGSEYRFGKNSIRAFITKEFFTNGPLPTGTYQNVTAGDHSEKFLVNADGTRTGVLGAKGTLTCSGTGCQYIDNQGTITDFIHEDYYYAAGLCIGVNSYMLTAIRVTKPDGEIITFDREVAPNTNCWRSGPVHSSLGWALTLDDADIDPYAIGLVPLPSHLATGNLVARAINTSVEYCGSTVATCMGTTANWPKRETDKVRDFTFSNGIVTSAISTATYKDALGQQSVARLDSNSNAASYISTWTTARGVVTTYTYKASCQSSPCNDPNAGQLQSISKGEHTINYSRGWYTLPPQAPPGSQPQVSSGYDIAVDYWPAAYGKLLLTRGPWPAGNTTYTWSEQYGGRITKVADPDATANGGHTAYEYDARGNITAIRVVPKDGSTPLVTSATYSPTCSNRKTCNKPLTTTDQTGVTTTFTYSPDHGGMLTATKGSIQTRYAYEQRTPYIKNSSGSLVASTPVWRLVSISKCMTMSLATCAGSTDEAKTVIGYGTNNVLPVTRTVMRGDGSLAQTSTIAYDIFGNVISTDGPRPGSYDTTYYFYDVLRRKIGEIGTDPDGPGPRPRMATRMVYNADSQTTSIEKGTVTGTDLSALNNLSTLEQHTTEYSSATGFPIVERDYAGGALQRVTQKSYNPQMRLECVAQRLDPNAWNTLPSSACAMGSAGPDGKDRITRLSYIGVKVASVTSGYGTPNPRTDRANSYDSVTGLLTAETDALGNKTVYTYDLYKRPYQTIYPTPGNGSVSSNTDYVQTNYTGALPSSVRLRDGQVVSLGYDALARLTSKSGALSETFNYNNFNQIVSHTNNTTNAATSLTSGYSFNSLGWVLTETRYAGTTSLGSVNYGYDAYGRRNQLNWPDNFYVTYDYVTNGYPGDNLQAIRESGGGTLASFSYDDRGRRVGLARGNGVVTSYGYDSLSRLVQLETDVGGGMTDDIFEAFSYTVAGQLKSQTLNVQNSAYRYTPTAGTITNYAANALNQLTSSNGAGMSYDARGNMSTDALGGSFSYNASNLLTSATQSGATTTLAYDAENRLHSIAKSGSTTKFIYDGVDLIAETDANNNLLRRYVHGPSADDPIVWYEGAGNGDKRYLATDHRGTIVGISNSAGLNLAVNAYDEYGIPKPSNTGRFQYTGQTWLGEVGLYYYKARLYNPTLGRFMQTDPIGYKDDLNLYVYVGNDSINSNDPSGLYQCGSGLSKGECKAVERAEKQIVAGLNKAAGRLRSTADKLANGEKLGFRDKRIIARAERTQGVGSGTESGLRGLADKADTLATEAASDNVVVENGLPSKEGNLAFYGGNTSMPGHKDTIFVTQYFYDASSDTRARALVHEETHRTFGFPDQPVVGGLNGKAYGWSGIDLLMQQNPALATSNVDSLVYNFFNGP